MTKLRKQELVVPAFIAVFAILLLIGLASYRRRTATVETEQWVAHTHEVIEEITATLSLAEDIESSARGYVISGQETFLESSQARTREVGLKIQSLRQLTADNPDQQRLLDTLEPLIARKIEISQRIVALRKTEGRAAAEKVVDTGEGKRVMDEIHGVIAAMHEVENQLLRRRTQALRTDNAKTFGFFLMLIALLAGLILVIFFLVRRMAARQQRELELTEKARAFSKNIVDTVREPLLVLDAEMRVQSANRSFYQAFRVTPQETEGKPVYELGNGQWDIPELRRLLEEILPQRTSFQDFEVRHDFPGIGHRTMLLNARRTSRAGYEAELILLAIEDITERKQAEEAARQAGAWQRAIVSHAGCALISTTPEGVIRTFNPAAESMLGYRAEEIAGGTPEIFHDPREVAERARLFSSELGTDIEPGFEVFVAKARRNLPNEHEWTYIRKDGTRLTVLLLVTALRDVDGGITGFLGVATDITARREAEEERNQAFALSRDLICVAGFDGYFKRLNPAWEKALGFTMEELLAAPFLDFILPEDRESSAAAAESLATGQELASFENRFRCKDGSFKWFLWSATPSVERQLIYAVAHEITGRKQAEMTLQVSHLELQNRFETAVRASGQLFYDWNPLTDAISYGNAEGVLGYADEEMGGSLAQRVELVHPDDRAAFRKELDRSVQTQNPFHQEYRLRRKDGEYIYVEDRGYPTLGEAGNVRGVVGFVADISERKKLEEQFRQAQKMEAVGRLAGGIAHDFNNLLTVILGFNDLLRDRIKGDEGALNYATEIRKAGERAANLTRQLLAFSRKQVLEPRVLDLNGIVSDQGKMLRRLIGEDISLITVAAPDLGKVKADPGQIEQVILNLAVNARDAMPHGGRLTVETANVVFDESYARTHVEAPPGQYVMIAVSDTGTGMDAKTQARIFEPFFTTKKQGTGLGLATVYGIVKQSGGNIWVYSEPGKGTTFKVYLPRVDAEAEAKRLAVPQEAARGGSEMVLLVEDSESLRAMAREFLERAGYTVLEATDGSEAVRMAEERKTPIDLLLTDVVMPGMSGREVAQQVKRHHPETKVLYMSGYTDDAIVHHGVLEEGVSLLSKPFARESLVRKIREVLDARG